MTERVNYPDVTWLSIVRHIVNKPPRTRFNHGKTGINCNISLITWRLCLLLGQERGKGDVSVTITEQMGYQMLTTVIHVPRIRFQDDAGPVATRQGGGGWRQGPATVPGLGMRGRPQVREVALGDYSGDLQEGVSNSEW